MNSYYNTQARQLPLYLPTTLRLILIFILLNTASIWAQNRAVAVVYDNSRSMTDAGQCEGINYALQVMVGLLHPSDQLLVYRMYPAQGDLIPLSNKQQAMNNIANTYGCRAGYTPFEAVIDAQIQLKQSNKPDKWLLILSDGEITDDNFSNKYPDDLQQFVNDTGGRIIFLNVNDRLSTLDNYFTQNNTTQQTLKTQGSFEGIVDNMEQIAANIMTLSGGVPIAPKKTTLSFNAPIPLKRIIVLQQEARKKTKLPTIVNAKANNKILRVGKAFKAQKTSSHYTMSGLITNISQAQAGVIPKGEIVLDFSGNIDASKTKVLPEAAVELKVRFEGSIKTQNGSMYLVCDTAKYLTVIAELVDLSGNSLDNNVLQSSIVSYVNEKTQEAIRLRLNEATKQFTAQIPVQAGRLPVSVTAQFPGYFNFYSNIFTIDRAECPVPVAYLETDKKVINAKVTDLKNAEALRVYPKIQFGDANPRNPTPTELDMLDIKVLSDTRLRLKAERENGALFIRPVANWCACFTPTGSETLEIALQSNNANLKLKPNNKVLVKVNIEDDSFWAKCGWLIIATILALFLLWYIIGIIKKPRFCSGSEIMYGKQTQLSKRKPRSYPLPQSFFKRYLIPYLPEKCLVGSVTFKAGSRCSHILLSKETQSDNMYISGYPIDSPKQKDLRISNGERLEIARNSSKEVYEYQKI